MTRSTVALIGALSLTVVGCRGFDPAPPKGKTAPPANRSGVVNRTPPPPTPGGTVVPIRLTEKVLSFYVPPHVSGGRLVEGHSIHIPVEEARWWTQAVHPDDRPAPKVEGPMLDRHRTRSSRSLWNLARRGAFVPWTTGATRAAEDR